MADQVESRDQSDERSATTASVDALYGLTPWERWLLSVPRYLLRVPPIFLVLVVAAALAALGLTNHLFWEEEANTTLFARNLLNFGELTAWDGINLIGYQGGLELNDSLVNTLIPPLQYYLAAAGMALFGETTLGGRILFVAAGVAALWLVYLWTRRHFGSRLPSYLPALLLALSPAYLLYIRQARYYPLGVLFSVALLLAWSSLDGQRRGFVAYTALAVAATAGLIFSNYLNAAALLGVLPVFLILARYRTRRHLQFLGSVYATAALCGVYVLLARNPFAVEVAAIDPTPALERLATLLWWNLSGLGVFEFMAVLTIPLLVLPLLFKKLSADRPLAADGAVVLLAMLVAVIITTLFSPQNIAITKMADMRFLVPMMVLGAAVTAIGLTFLWHVLRPLALVVGALVVFSNILHGVPLAARPLSCTLCAYVDETLHDYKTGTEALIDYLRSVPAGTPVLIRPDYMTYPAMFYLPELHYCWQLSADKAGTIVGGVDLPDYVVNGGQCIGRFFIGGADRRKINRGSVIEIGGTRYEFEGAIPTFWHDGSRPEIPWHSFGPVPERLNRERGFLVFKPVVGDDG
ncbi:MAG: hypothetical protein GY791_00485 [Alphaproteobacteria bacterium]|nr:hypothetical protein [Alphaproteobacteria bacterium]